MSHRKEKNWVENIDVESLPWGMDDYSPSHFCFQRDNEFGSL